LVAEQAMSVAEVYRRTLKPGEEVTVKGFVWGPTYNSEEERCSQFCDDDPVALVDAPLGDQRLALLVPRGTHELNRGDYVVVRGGAVDPAVVGYLTDARVLRVAAKVEAQPPADVPSPTYPDGSWSVAALRNRADLKAPDDVSITAFVVGVTPPCPPCPVNVSCKPCAPPEFMLADAQDAPGPSRLLVVLPENTPLPRLQVGKRYRISVKVEGTFPYWLTYKGKSTAAH
jgi:hypothetical protein